MPETIDVQINISDVSSQLQTAKRELESFKAELAEMPSTFSQGIDRTITSIELLQKKTENYERSTGNDRTK